MADHIAKKLTYDGNDIYAEYAKRDRLGNDIYDSISSKQPSLPLATASGKVLMSTDTAGGIAWGDKKLYEHHLSINLAQSKGRIGFTINKSSLTPISNANDLRSFLTQNSFNSTSKFLSVSGYYETDEGISTIFGLYASVGGGGITQIYAVYDDVASEITGVVSGGTIVDTVREVL